MVPLYKLDKMGRTQMWSIEVLNDSFRTLEGLIDGKHSYSEWTKCVPKNVGKSNETSGAEQAILEANARWKKKTEAGYWEDINNISLGKEWTQPMLAHKWEQYGKKMVGKRAFTQPKLDGIRSLIKRDGVWSRTGKLFESVSYLAELAQPLFDLYPNIIALDGELYNHLLKEDFNQIASLVSKKKPSLEEIKAIKESIQFHIYDIITEGSFETRTALIQSMELPKEFIKVETHLVENNLDELYATFLEEGYEGQMIRLADSSYDFDRSKSLLKRKEMQDMECEVLDILEGLGNRSGMAGKVALRYPNGKLFEAGIRGNFDFYKQILENKSEYIGKQATIRFQNLTPDGIPRFPVMIAFRDYE